MKYQATKTVSEFNCLQGDCPDTCCKGWSMQLDDKTFEKYKGTELEDSVAYDGQNDEIRVMKRDPETDYCVKFTDGICSVHAEQGSQMIGDACNFYPRVTRKLGDEHIMTATLSCPEIARLAFFEDLGFENTPQETDRLPNIITDYLEGDDITTEQAMKIHNSFLEACDDEAAPEKIMARIYSASESMKFYEMQQWAEGVHLMIKMGDMKLPAPSIDEADAYKLVQIFAGIVHATGKKPNPRLIEALEKIEKAIGAKINWETLVLEPTDGKALGKTLKYWEKNKSEMDSILKRYLKSQISFTTFPFAGLAADLEDKAKLLIFRFALTRLALMALLANDEVTDENVVLVVQSISRVLDHLGDATLTLSLFDQAGWSTDTKIRGLLMDS